jgi:uncharacterized ubiquitin-like protein YukD
MIINNTEVVCMVSIYETNTWYIFRANGIEVKIVMYGEIFKSDKKLTDLEIEYLENNLR